MKQSGPRSLLARYASPLILGGCLLSGGVFGSAAYEVLAEMGDTTDSPVVIPTPEPGADPNNPSGLDVPPQEPITDEAKGPDNPVIEDAARQLEIDAALPRFFGELGDFVIVEPDTSDNYPCPEDEQLSDEAELTESELYFELPGIHGLVEDGPTGGVVGTTCLDVVRSVSGEITLSEESGSSAYIVRSYFLDPHPQLPILAPASRLELTEFDGLPGLLEFSPEAILNLYCRAFVVQRAAEEGIPGVLLEVSGYLVDCDAVRGLTEELLAQEQFELG